MRLLCLVLCVALVWAHEPFQSPSHVSSWHETFEGDWKSRWVHSEDSKYNGRFEVEAPKGLEDKALKVPNKARHYGISALLDTPVDPAEGLVLQYDVKLSEGLSCGGAYLKFLTAEEAFTPTGLADNTAYTVMFGPDKCGATNKVHLILRHKNPKTGTIEEKHLKYPPSVETDKVSHTYTAILYPGNNSYAVLIDGEEKKAGSLFEDFDPAFNPPEEIDDPEDSKPSDWVDEAKISDPDAVKPEDWDEDAPREIPDEDAVKPEGWLDEEPLEVDDPEATKPEDWDDEEDGEWEAPMVANPKCKSAPGCGEWKRPTKKNPAYKGKWSAPLIDNPAYKGVWKPRKIPNPEYFNDEHPLQNIGKVGAAAIEIWTMDEGIYFDNVLVASDPAEAEKLRVDVWGPKQAVERQLDEEEQVKKAAEDEKKKADEDKKAAKSEQAKKLVSLIFDQPFLEPYAAKLAPVRAAVEAQPLLLASPLLLLLPVLLSLRGKKRKVDVVGQAKKQDVTAADDQPAAVVEEKRAGSSAAAAAKAEGEIEEEEEEEEEEDEKPAAAARRRVRRE